MGRDDLRTDELTAIAPEAATSTDLLAVKAEQVRSDVMVLLPRGDIDIATHDQFGDAMRTVISALPRLVIIDLDGVEFLASSGLEALLDGRHQAAELGVEVALAGGRRATLRVLELTGVLGSFRHFASVGQALR